MEISLINKYIADTLTQKYIEKCFQQFLSVVDGIKEYTKLYIYGAGGWGRSLQSLLKVYEITTTAFFDRNADQYEQQPTPVYDLRKFEISERDKQNSLVIIAVRIEQQTIVTDFLMQLGFQHIKTIDWIWHYGCWFKKNELLSIAREKENIIKCIPIWEDSKSLDRFYRQIDCYLSKKYNRHNKIDENQYFPCDIHFRKGYSSFIDCGAYTGDTVAMLTKHVGKIEKLVAFEPNAGNFNALVSNMSEEKDIIAEEIFIYPCGLWSKTKMLSFDSAMGHDCHISVHGDTFLQCVSLDECLFGFTPTFIKMDIEGAEIEAIKGATGIIRRYKPGLAISVYHKIEHLWQIPILLQSLNKNYKFYLRSHEHFNQETILYAV